ncbi:hypothetical protein PV08_02136 [Exophiala spinifera]|uniref:Uncharacterized protein n=1 Tax=Exophiala spinifera TaxID=91928 RepID=A0A0D1Z1N9_9EURO|nr:uncharacterized protein PV08_02136 [Exophiala spinifera]KIW21556.1 hypothetical protein PV08_02136 [Exophiala spinifera]
MRLLNCRTLQLEWFADDSIPEYAILSHRWDKGEVEFKDMRHLSKARRKEGFAKVRNSAKRAFKKHEVEYIWIDTCCINKDSSAELSEAINSMYAWYKNSTVCLVYLSDVPGDEPITSNSRFGGSVWFTRGWTLQELIAPERVEFYRSDWSSCGTKQDLQKVVACITRIPESVLGDGNLEQYSVAQRMSWASDRETTRVEDVAYSLIGIFDVNMPMIYGEGKKAFMRLQEEIIKRSSDQSIFAWTNARNKPTLLAPSPAYFKDCDDVSYGSHFASSGHLNPYALTNTGLEIHLALLAWSLDVYVGLLGCSRMPKRAKKGRRMSIGIFLFYSDSGRYYRTTFEGLRSISFEDSEMRAFLSGGQVIHGRTVLIHPTIVRNFNCLYGFRIKQGIPNGFWQVASAKANLLAHHWDAESGEVSIDEGTAGTVAVIFFDGLFDSFGQTTFMQLAFDDYFNPCCLIGRCDRDQFNSFRFAIGQSDMLRAYPRRPSPRSPGDREKFPKASWAKEEDGWAVAIGNWKTKKVDVSGRGMCHAYKLTTRTQLFPPKFDLLKTAFPGVYIAFDRFWRSGLKTPRSWQFIYHFPDAPVDAGNHRLVHSSSTPALLNG